MKKPDEQSFSTRAVHAGERAMQGDYTPVSSPIHPSVGFTYESMGKLDRAFDDPSSGYVYPRYGSPTVTAFEAAVADLEGGQAALAFGSGMAAIYAVLLSAGARSGAIVVAALDLYGATYALIDKFLPEAGAKAVWVDATDPTAVEQALNTSASQRPSSLILLVESISNPLLKVADLPSLAELANRYGAHFLVDNTFASPYLLNPLKQGAEYCIHSATKYIAGHGDVMAGVVVTSQENRSRLYEINKLVGGVLGPFEAWLALRGLKTLPLRMQKQCANASEVADWLSMRPEIAAVNYPGLPAHPQHDLAKSLFGGKGFGGMLSFEIAGAGKAKTFQFMEALRLCQPATTLGDIYTLVLHPATSSHRALSAEQRERTGISDGLVRLSTGIEDPADLIADLEGALLSIAE
jgi:cystathionine beta-lyase/cystathionine gamma-synthase